VSEMLMVENMRGEEIEGKITSYKFQKNGVVEVVSDVAGRRSVVRKESGVAREISLETCI